YYYDAEESVGASALFEFEVCEFGVRRRIVSATGVRLPIPNSVRSLCSELGEEPCQRLDLSTNPELRSEFVSSELAEELCRRRASSPTPQPPPPPLLETAWAISAPTPETSSSKAPCLIL